MFSTRSVGPGGKCVYLSGRDGSAYRSGACDLGRCLQCAPGLKYTPHLKYNPHLKYTPLAVPSLAVPSYCGYPQLEWAQLNMYDA